MAIAEVASGTVTRDGTNDWTVTKPAAVAAGHVAVLVISWDATSTTTVATPTGWTVIAANIGNTSMKASAFYRVIQSGDTSWLVDINHAGNSLGGVFKAFSGVDNTTPIDATGTASTNTGNTSIVANAVTIATSGAWHMIGLGAWNGSTTFTATGFSDQNNGNTANQPADLQFNTSPQSTGSTGSVTVTASGSGAGQILSAIPFALRPAGGGGGTDVTVNADVVGFVASVQAPTLTGDGSASPAVISFVGAVQSPAVSGDAAAAGGVVSLTGSLQSPAVAADAGIAADLLAVVGSPQSPTVAASSAVAAALLNLAGSLLSAAAAGDASVAADVLAAVLSLQAPAVDVGGSITVTADLLALAASLPAPAVVADALAAADLLTLAGSDLDAYATGDVLISADLLGLVASLLDPDVTGGGSPDVTVNAGVLSLAATLLAVSVSAGMTGRKRYGIRTADGLYVIAAG